MGPTVLLTPEAFMRPTGGVRRYADELYSAISTFGVPRKVGVEFGDRVSRAAGRRLGGSSARLMVDLKLRSLVRGADLVHSVYYDCSVVGKRLPLVVTFHDCIHERFALTGALRSAVLSRDKRRSVERARFVMSASQATANDAAEFYGLEPERSVVLHPPVSDAFTGVIEAGSESPALDRSYFLFVGPRETYKNWALVVSAIGALPPSVDVGLISVGGGALSAGDQQALTRAGLGGDRHKWFGQIDDRSLARLYRSSIAVVCPSDYEGFGYPVAEALCVGGRAIASDGGSLAEFEQHGARLFPAGQVDGLREALVQEVEIRGDTPIGAAERRVGPVAQFGRTRFVDGLSKIYSAVR